MKKATPTQMAGAKHRFDDLYVSESPIPYSTAMLKVGYREDDYFKLATEDIARFAQEMGLSDQIHILDICSGYGINALYLRTGLQDAAIFEALAQGDFLLPEERQNLLPTQNLIMTGLDIAAPALRFAEKVQLHNHSLSTNLEKEALTEEQTALLKDLDVIISTGSSSYITEQTFGKVLNAIAPKRPLLFLFWPLVGAECKATIETLQAHGFTVDIDRTPRPQRRFATDEERTKFAKIYDAQDYPPDAAARENICVYRIKALRS